MMAATGHGAGEDMSPTCSLDVSQVDQEQIGSEGVQLAPQKMSSGQMTAKCVVVHY